MTGMAGDARLARRRRAIGAGAAVALATTLATACAHSLAGGAAPDALLLAVAAVATLAMLVPVLGPRAGLPRQVLAVALAQLLQHGLYALPHGSAPAADVHAHHVHGAGARVALDVASLDHGGAGMPLAHVVAGLLALAALRAAPRAVAALLAAAPLRAVAAVLAWTPPLGEPRPRAVAAARPALLPRLAVLTRSIARRGPPLALV